MAGTNDAPPDMEFSEGSAPSTPSEPMDADISDLRASTLQEQTMVCIYVLMQFLDEGVRQRYLTELGDLFLDPHTPVSH